MDRNQWADVAIGGIAGGIQGWTQGKLQENEAARIEKETARREGLIQQKAAQTRKTFEADRQLARDWRKEDAKEATDYKNSEALRIEGLKPSLHDELEEQITTLMKVGGLSRKEATDRVLRENKLGPQEVKATGITKADRNKLIEKRNKEYNEYVAKHTETMSSEPLLSKADFTRRDYSHRLADFGEGLETTANPPPGGGLDSFFSEFSNTGDGGADKTTHPANTAIKQPTPTPDKTDITNLPSNTETPTGTPTFTSFPSLGPTEANAKTTTEKPLDSSVETQPARTAEPHPTKGTAPPDPKKDISKAEKLVDKVEKNPKELTDKQINEYVDAYEQLRKTYGITTSPSPDTAVQKWLRGLISNINFRSAFIRDMKEMVDRIKIISGQNIKAANEKRANTEARPTRTR